jgi:hypothetical protein
MEFNQLRIAVADAVLTLIVDWTITEGAFGCKVAAF